MARNIMRIEGLVHGKRKGGHKKKELTRHI
jgi:hypothetical protein